MTTEADSPIRTERRGAALWLWLNRPHALNSLTLPMVRGLHQGLDLAADPDVRVVVIAGKGRAFCAGADLTQVLGWVSGDAEPAAEDDFLQQVGAAFDRLEAFEKPVIAAVHGLAVAGGALDQAARRGTAELLSVCRELGLCSSSASIRACTWWIRHARFADARSRILARSSVRSASGTGRGAAAWPG